MASGGGSNVRLCGSEPCPPPWGCGPIFQTRKSLLLSDALCPIHSGAQITNEHSAFPLASPASQAQLRGGQKGGRAERRGFWEELRVKGPRSPEQSDNILAAWIDSACCISGWGPLGGPASPLSPPPGGACVLEVQGQELRAQLCYYGQAASLFGASVSPPVKWRRGRGIPRSTGGRMRSVCVCRPHTHTLYVT